MSKTKTVALTEPAGEIAKITLREPKGSDLTDLGMPGVWVTLPGVPGGGFFQEMPAVYLWMERLADNPDCLGKLCLRDALAVRAVVLQFFFDAWSPLDLAPGDQPSVGRLQ